MQSTLNAIATQGKTTVQGAMKTKSIDSLNMIPHWALFWFVLRPKNPKAAISKIATEEALVNVLVKLAKMFGKC